jgi:hypothetical protein
VVAILQKLCMHSLSVLGSVHHNVLVFTALVILGDLYKPQVHSYVAMLYIADFTLIRSRYFPQHFVFSHLLFMFFSQSKRAGLRTIKHVLSWYKMLKRQVDNYSKSSSEIKNAWSFTCMPL